MLTNEDLEAITEAFRNVIKNEMHDMIDDALQEKRNTFLSAAETAKLIGCSVKTLYSKSCKIPHTKVGKYLQFSRDDVLRYLGILK
jgi:hypothetical protein